MAHVASELQLVTLRTVGDTADLYRAIIGQRGRDYYLDQFLRFDAAGRSGPSWHWPACCFTLAWLAYRRLWRPAMAYLGLWLLLGLGVLGAGRLLLGYSAATALLWAATGLAIASVVAGRHANAWFYEDCLVRIDAAIRATPDIARACEVLAAQAGSGRRWWTVALVQAALLAVLLGAVFSLLGPPAREALAPPPQPIAVPPPARAPVPAPAALVAALVDVAPVNAAPASAPLPAASAHEAAPTAAPAQAASVAASAPTSVRARPIPVPQQQPKAARGDLWALQVGAFADPANAQALRQRLAAQGLPLLDEAPGRRLQRVRVGPLASQAEIERAEEQLRALDLPTVLVRP